MSESGSKSSTELAREFTGRAMSTENRDWAIVSALVAIALQLDVLNQAGNHE